MKFATRFLIVGLAVLVAAPAFAGIGIHLNYDNTTIEEDARSFSLPGDPTGLGTSTLTRTESSNPVGVGFDLTLTLLPIIDLQISLEMAAGSYDFVYTPAPLSLQDPIAEENVPYLRGGVDATAIINLPFLSFPPAISVIKTFVGGGPSIMVLAPIVSEDLIKDNITSASEELDYEDAIKAELNFGFHAIAGFKIKPPAFPIGLRVYGKYYMMTGVDEPTPDSWMTFGAGIYIGG